jgi:hypothetical protein
MGVTRVGVFRGVGFKNGAWDVGWWHRPLVAPPSRPKGAAAMVSTRLTPRSNHTSDRDLISDSVRRFSAPHHWGHRQAIDPLAALSIRRP